MLFRSLILRLLNPDDEMVEAEVTLGFPFSAVSSARLDEEPDAGPLSIRDESVRVPIGPHALRTLRVRTD